MFFDNKVKCFLTLAETLSFTATARELYLSQQAVSKIIASIEAELGFSLFNRTTRSVSLTDAGQRLYDFFCRQRNEYNSLMTEIRYQYLEQSNSINVGFQNFLDFGSIPSKALAKLSKEYPEARQNGVRYSPLTLIEHLTDHRLDLIIINGRFAPDLNSFSSLLLTTTPQALMVSVENPLITPQATYKTFVNEPFIIDSFENESSAEFEQRVTNEIKKWGLKPSKIIWVPDRDSAYTKAELGHGIVIGTEMSRIARDRSLKKYYTGKSDTLLAVWNKNETNPLVRRYAEYLQKEYDLQKARKKVSSRKEAIAN